MIGLLAVVVEVELGRGSIAFPLEDRRLAGPGGGRVGDEHEVQHAHERVVGLRLDQPLGLDPEEGALMDQRVEAGVAIALVAEIDVVVEIVVADRDDRHGLARAQAFSPRACSSRAAALPRAR